MKMVDTKARLVKDTEKAVLVERPSAGQLWIPKSLVRFNSWGDGITGVAIWFAKKHAGFFTK